MTLNSVVNRIQTIALAHKQVRRFFKGFASDFLSNKTDLYPGVLLQDNDGGISFENNQLTLNFSMMCVDLVHVSADTKTNEQDVHSDMLSVILDILAQMNYPAYHDWKIEAGNIQMVSEEDGDMYAGVKVDIQIKSQYKQNVCAIPTTITEYVGDGDIDVIVPASGEITLRAYNTGNRVRVRIYEDTGTQEPQWEIEKL